MNTRQITPELDVLSAPFPAPPEVAQVVRVAPQARSAAVFSLVDEIAQKLVRPDCVRAA